LTHYTFLYSCGSTPASLVLWAHVSLGSIDLLVLVLQSSEEIV